MLVLSGKLKDTDVPTVVTEIKQTLAKHNAVVIDEAIWGRLKFSYEIAHEKTGVYELMHIDLDPTKTQALSAELRVVDHVLRLLLIDNPKHGAVIEAPTQTPGRERTGTGTDRGEQSRAPEKAATVKTPTEAGLDKTLKDILGDKDKTEKPDTSKKADASDKPEKS